MLTGPVLYGSGFYGAVLIALWGLLTMLTLGWLLLTDPGPAPAAPADPYAREVAAFRAELHDWDRGHAG